jgi:hypothetical protein
MPVVAISASFAKSANFFPRLDLLFPRPYPQFFEAVNQIASWSANFASSSAGKPDCCHYRRQRIVISEALSTHRGTRSSGEDGELHRF